MLLWNAFKFGKILIIGVILKQHVQLIVLSWQKLSYVDLGIQDLQSLRGFRTEIEVLNEKY